MKRLYGTCLRQDNLLFMGNAKRKSNAEIIFEQKKDKHGIAEVDYWLKEHKLESFQLETDLPRLLVSNKLPFNPIKIPKGKINYKIILSSDSTLIINAKMARVTSQLTNENNYFIDKRTWLIKGIECKGNFRVKPLKKGSSYYFFQTDTKFTYGTIGDSCILNNYTGKFLFSHKKVDPQKLWEYFVNMDITSDKNITPRSKDKKLRPLDFLLYKNEDKKVNAITK